MTLQVETKILTARKRIDAHKAAMRERTGTGADKSLVHVSSDHRPEDNVSPATTSKDGGHSLIMTEAKIETSTTVADSHVGAAPRVDRDEEGKEQPIEKHSGDAAAPCDGEKCRMKQRGRERAVIASAAECEEESSSGYKSLKGQQQHHHSPQQQQTVFHSKPGSDVLL